MNKFKYPILTVDGLILKDDKVLLLKRDIPPFEDFWVLPGGHVDYNEKVEQAIRREIGEELGIKVKIKKITGVYSAPERDPRYHAVSVAFWLKRKGGEIRLNQEAGAFDFFELNDLPPKIGFDHRKIITDFRESF